jgi:predicted small lipoprotein YifL
MRRAIRQLILAALLLLSACGQTGPLTLPETLPPESNDEQAAQEDDD